MFLGSLNEPQAVAVTRVEWQLAVWERSKLRVLRAGEVEACA